MFQKTLKQHCGKLGSRTERYINKGKVGQSGNKVNQARPNPKNLDALAGIDRARQEVQFFDDREPEVEIFRSDGKIFALETVPIADGNEEV